MNTSMLWELASDCFDPPGLNVLWVCKLQRHTCTRTMWEPVLPGEILNSWWTLKCFCSATWPRASGYQADIVVLICCEQIAQLLLRPPSLWPHEKSHTTVILRSWVTSLCLSILKPIDASQQSARDLSSSRALLDEACISCCQVYSLIWLIIDAWRCSIGSAGVAKWKVGISSARAWTWTLAWHPHIAKDY